MEERGFARKERDERGKDVSAGRKKETEHRGKDDEEREVVDERGRRCERMWGGQFGRE